MLKSLHIIFYETNAAPRKRVVDDDVDIEDLRIEELKDKEELEDSKEEPSLEDLQRKED